MSPQPKDLTRVLVAKLPDGRYQCRLCNKIRKLSPSGGYTNTMDHLRRSHDTTYLSEFALRASRPQTMDSFVSVVVDATAMNTYQWLDWIVMGRLPLDFCENPRTRKYVKLETMSAKTLKLRAGLVEVAVQGRIRARLLGKRIGLMYDAWTEAKTHYVAVIAVIPSDDDPSKPEKYLLCFTPFEDETDMSAEAFIELFDYVLDLYGIDVIQLVFVTCDHASVNTSFASKAQLPMLGCASHRFQLAVNRILEPHERLLAKISAFMGMLNSVKNRAKLRAAGKTMPAQKNATRWSSTFMMVKSFRKLHEDIDRSDKRLMEALPTPRELLELEDLFKQLTDLESVNKKLQELATKMTATTTAKPRHANLLSHLLLLMFGSYSTAYLAPKASVVKAPEFESGIIKVLTGKEGKLSASEERALTRFRREEAASDEEQDEAKLSFAEKLLRATKPKASRFIDLRWIPPTSNDVERLFSKAGLVLTDRRRRLNPTTLETLVMLEFNRSLWDAELVAAALKNRKRQRTE